MATYLDGIVAWHRDRVEADDRDLGWLAEQAAAAREADPPRGFLRELEGEGVSLIAEVKRRSPSKGPLCDSCDPAEVATAYEAGGAACCSVLTDGPHFAGSPEDLRAVRRSVHLPVLRKDFTCSLRDVYDARIMGADAVLLIAAVLDDESLAAFQVAAASVGLDALVEVHDEREAARALASGAALVGVNQRDLETFEVDRTRAVRVAAALGAEVVRVAESGIDSAEAVRALGEAGFDAVLVGERLMRAPDRVAACRELVGA